MLPVPIPRQREARDPPGLSLPGRPRAGLLLCMLAYSGAAHHGARPGAAAVQRRGHPQPRRPGGAAPRSAEAKREDLAKLTAEGFAVHSFRTLLALLGSLVKNRVIPHGATSAASFDPW